MSMFSKIVAIGAVSLLVACASQQGEALRPQLTARKAQSVAEWDGGETLLRSATGRTGFLLREGEDAIGVPIRTQLEGGVWKEEIQFVRGEGRGRRTKIGAAVPITTDGYFLTAKHCLGPAPAVFLHDRKNEKVTKSMAQVVWASGDDADLALLRTSHRIAEPFALANFDSVGEGDRVGSTGWSGLLEGGAFDGMGAGKVRAISIREERQPEALRWWNVEHDSPIQPGDSGGPLIDSHGRLIGIHSGGKVGAIAIYQPKPEGAPLRGFTAISNLPDPAWLMRRIEEDRRASRAQP